MAKQARALRTYDRVLDAAAHEFARYGYPNANLQRIADRVDLTKGALYGHFANKQELAAALDHHLSTSLESLLSDAAASPASAFARLHTFTLAAGELFRQDVRALAALRLAFETALSADEPVPLLERTYDVVLHLVGQTQREGQWDVSVPPEPLADLILALLFGALWTRTGADRAGADRMWDVLSRALGKDPGPRVADPPGPRHVTTER